MDERLTLDQEAIALVLARMRLEIEQHIADRIKEVITPEIKAPPPERVRYRVPAVMGARR